MTHLPTAKLINKELIFTEPTAILRAFEYGAFYLEYPSGIDFTAGIKIAKNYYIDKNGGELDHYRGFHKKNLEKSLLGYSCTGNDQDELLQIENTLWNDYFTEDVGLLLWEMNEISRQVLYCLFFSAKVKRNDIEKIINGLGENNALQYCIFNHFRSVINQAMGLTAHKDSGFITLLYTIEPGLESFYKDRWIPFEPREGCFTIVIGHAFEILTKNMNVAVNASYHRVVASATRKSTNEDRYTFGTYIGPIWNQYLYTYNLQGKLIPTEPFIEFQKRKAEEMEYEFHPKVSN
ncbi:2OG-Fe(II) oxygenase family protein [Sodalis sp. RH21]|uniref:2OG-Fe(II) oxygenase family protein n=1 Tax=unclassified Sodalis (in: enterobacteria) TaxID=2636512 RepID=UPI0039B420CB